MKIAEIVEWGGKVHFPPHFGLFRSSYFKANFTGRGDFEGNSSLFETRSGQKVDDLKKNHSDHSKSFSFSKKFLVP